MHKKSEASVIRIPVTDSVCMSEPDIVLADLVYGLSSAFQMNPCRYIQEEKRLIWLYFPGVCLSAGQLLSDYALSAAVAARQYPLSFYGSIFPPETAEICAELNKDGTELTVSKYNVSGEDFEEISDLCLKISVPDLTVLRELAEVFRHLDFQQDFLVLRRSAYTARAFKNCSEVSPDTYYSYIPVNENADSNVFFSALSVRRQTKLWLLLLNDGVSAPEFDYVFSALEEGFLRSLFSWELSLRLALSEAGVSITYGERGFSVTRRDGQRIYYDFQKGSSAEKIFLKIIFPAPPKRT